MRAVRTVQAGPAHSRDKRGGERQPRRRRSGREPWRDLRAVRADGRRQRPRRRSRRRARCRECRAWYAPYFRSVLFMARWHQRAMCHRDDRRKQRINATREDPHSAAKTVFAAATAECGVHILGCRVPRFRSAQPIAARPPRRRQDTGLCSQSLSDPARSGWRECFRSPCKSSTPSYDEASGCRTPLDADRPPSPIHRLGVHIASCSCASCDRSGSGTRSPRPCRRVVLAMPVGSLSHQQ